MKKVLSVLLAAAMVAGMSVSSFAATVAFSPANKATTTALPIFEDELGVSYKNIQWGNVFHARDLDGNGKFEGAEITGYDQATNIKLLENDVLYFEVLYAGEGQYDGDPATASFDRLINHKPSNWVVKVDGDSEYVKDAEFVVEKNSNNLFVEVTMGADFDAKDIEREDETETVEFWMYIYDTKNYTQSDYATVHYTLEDYETVVLSKTDVKKVVVAEEDTIYKLSNDQKSAMVVFDFGRGVLVKAKLYKGDEYLVKDSTAFKFEKELSKKYDTDIDVVTFDTELDVREVIFESAKDNKQVVAVVDGELVKVEATEFVTKYEIIADRALAKGYIAEIDANEGAYALVSADLEVEVEAEEEVEAEKANPETGAADFVGAAVAMAVVSVAAAGALALKK